MRRLEGWLFGIMERHWLGIDEGIEVTRIDFVSPLTSKYPASDRGYFQHYRAGADRAVIMLPQRGGGYDTARMLSLYLATHGYDVYALQPPHRGERRPLDALWESLAADELKTLVFQAVSEIHGLVRYIPQQRLGIVGTSLGASYAAIAFGSNPGIRSAALIAGAIDLEAFLRYSGDKLARALRHEAGSRGLSLCDYYRTLRSIDPALFLDQGPARRVLIVSGVLDRVTPARRRDRHPTGARELTLPAGHAGLALFSKRICKAITRHFQATL